jgi:hypothetical protein
VCLSAVLFSGVDVGGVPDVRSVDRVDHGCYSNHPNTGDDMVTLMHLLRSAISDATPSGKDNRMAIHIPRARSKPRSRSATVSRTGAYTVAIVAGCGHRAHVGTCPVCQRAQLQRQATHLAAAKAARARWQAAKALSA